LPHPVAGVAALVDVHVPANASSETAAGSGADGLLSVSLLSASQPVVSAHAAATAPMSRTLFRIAIISAQWRALDRADSQPPQI
jgi:hypothetical protein